MFFCGFGGINFGIVVGEEDDIAGGGFGAGCNGGSKSNDALFVVEFIVIALVSLFLFVNSVSLVAMVVLIIQVVNFYIQNQLILMQGS